MDILSIALLAAVVLLALILVVVLMRQGGGSREAEQRNAAAARPGAEPAGRDRAAGREVAARAGAGAGQGRRRAARPHREGHRPDRHRPARAADPHRRGAEEDRRTLDPGRQPAGGPVQQAGARRLRRGPAERPGPVRPAALGLCLPGDALDRRARRLPAPAAQPAGPDRHRRQVPAGELQPAARGAGRRTVRRCWRPSAASSRRSASISATSGRNTSCPARPPNRR